MLRRLVACVVVIGLVPLATTGCFGNFALTRKVYHYNQDVHDSKWVRWPVFLVLTAVPVYGLATMFDALFANSVEFWTGQNPVRATSASQRVVRGPNGETARATRLAPGVVRVEIVEKSGSRRELTLVRESGSMAAYGPDGDLLARIADGAPDDAPAR